MTSNLREALIEKQRELGLIDAEIAPRIGIDRSTWTHIRNGRPLPSRLVPAVVQEFPDLLEFHLLDLQAPNRSAGAA